MQERTLGGFRRPPFVTSALMIVWVVVFLVTGFGTKLSPDIARGYELLVLDASEVLRGHRLWSVFTSGLLHSLSDVFHLIFNCLALYWFAPEIEIARGRRGFIGYLVGAQLLASGFVIAAYALGLTSGLAIGGSGMTMAVTTLWGLTYRDRELMFFFVRLKGIHLVWISLGIEILNSASSSNVSAAAHFGGMFFGFLASPVSPFRRWYLQRKFKNLQAQSSELRGAKTSSRGPKLRVIEGGRGDKKDLLN